VRAGWVGQEAEAQWGEGERPVGEKKGMGRGWAERPDGPKAEDNYFQIKFGFLNIQMLWKFAQGDLGGILT
jgi:hypothetical protein